jgi:hypothetical protein
MSRALLVDEQSRKSSPKFVNPNITTSTTNLTLEQPVIRITPPSSGCILVPARAIGDFYKQKANGFRAG